MLNSHKVKFRLILKTSSELGHKITESLTITIEGAKQKQNISNVIGQ